MSLAFYLYLGVSSAIFIAAASASRAYVTTDKVAWFVFALFLYGVGNWMMVKVMRDSSMGIAFTVSSITQLVFVNIIAFLVFGERLSPLQYTGVALGVVSVALIVWPQSSQVTP